MCNAESSSTAPTSDCMLSSAVVKVWDLVNNHFETLLSGANRSASLTEAKTKICSQTTKLKELRETCNYKLKVIKTYVSELQTHVSKRPEEKRVSHYAGCLALTGEWTFLYLQDNRVFGYMKLIPDTVSVSSENDNADSEVVRKAKFTVPIEVLSEANLATEDPELRDLDLMEISQAYATCPCCKVPFCCSEFWKHALFEIAQQGNTVPAWQSLDHSETQRWTVESSSGWNQPIYRPRALTGTCDLARSFAELHLSHLTSEAEFSHSLDSVFQFLTSQLNP